MDWKPSESDEIFWAPLVALLVNQFHFLQYHTPLLNGPVYNSREPRSGIPQGDFFDSASGTWVLQSLIWD